VQSVTKTLSSSGFGICGAVIARNDLVANIDNDALKRDFALRQITAQPGLRAEPASDAGGAGAGRHAHAALEGGHAEP
jgi:hypothetical protein